MPRSFRTGDQALVREINRAILLNLLRTHSPQSRADLAAATGLNKATVSGLIADLISTSWVREIGIASSAGGRPAVLLELNPDAGCIIGAEIGVWYVKVILTDFKADRLWHRRIELERNESSESALTKFETLLDEAVKVARTRLGRVLGLGLSVQGLVDFHTGTLLFGPNLNWRNVGIRARLERQYTFPIHVDNDAKAAALGERYFGAGQAVDNFVAVIADIGLGSGIWLGDRIHRGSAGMAGEIGHTTLIPNGPVCHCGNRGCWETVASQQALIERLRAAVAGGASTLLPTQGGSLADVNMHMIVDAARQGDATVLRALDETGAYLGMGIANLINTFNPSLVVLGGSFSLAADFLMPAIRRTVDERAMPRPLATTQIQVAAHGIDSGMMGGVALVLHDLLSHPRLDVPVAIKKSDRIRLHREVVTSA